MTRPSKTAFLAGAATAAAMLLAALPAAAAETIAYSYDARGRLVQVARSTSGTATTTSYGFDKADNRLSKTVSGGTPPPPAGPTLSVADASGPEGGDIVFTVTKTGSAAASTYWHFGDISAAWGSDYVLGGSGFLEWGPNETTKTITATALNDSVAEPSETFRIYLYNSSGAAIAREGIGTITGPSAPPTLSVADAAGPEGSNLVFTVTKTGSGAASAYWHFGDISASYQSDYLPEGSGFLEWGPNETTKTITVAALNDSITEPAETFRVFLYNPSGAAIAREGIGTISGP
jgi:YD repeat-containing protein